MQNDRAGVGLSGLALGCVTVPALTLIGGLIGLALEKAELIGDGGPGLAVGAAAGLLSPLLWISWRRRVSTLRERRDAVEAIRRQAEQAAEAARRQAEQAAEAARRQAELAAEAARVRREQVENERRALAAERRAMPERLVHAYERAVADLERAKRTVDSARQLQTDRAFTPFWESVEASFAALTDHRASLASANQVLQRARDVSDRLSELGALTNGEAEGADVWTVPPQAADLNTVDAYDAVAGDLEEVVYQAQRIYEFASIYEQRRTTSAIVAGFGSLARAVAAVGGEIRRANSELQTGMIHLAASASKNPLSEQTYEYSYGSLGTSIAEMSSALKRLAEN